MIPGLSHSLIQAHTTPAVFARGEAYARKGAVRDLRLQPGALHAHVSGSELYEVSVSFDAGGVREASCTCPYDYSGWCKHVVAVLLAALEQDEAGPGALVVALAARSPLDEALEEAEPEVLRAVLRRLVEEHRLTGDDLLHALRGTTPVPGAEQIKAQMQSLIRSLTRSRSSDAYWRVHEVAGLAEKFRVALEAAWRQNGDVEAVLQSMAALTQELLRAIRSLDDSDGHLYGTASGVAETWTRMLLDPDLSSKARRAWLKKLEKWDEELGDMGVEDFGVAAGAAHAGWDAPALRSLLEGAPAGEDDLRAALALPAAPEDDGDEEEEMPGPDSAAAPSYSARHTPHLWWGAETLLALRIDALEARGRADAALRLAALGADRARYVSLLFAAGRASEAVAEALRFRGAGFEHLGVARVLREHGHLQEALRVARAGMRDPARRDAPLAEWTAALAEGLGEHAAAAEAAAALFRVAPSVRTLERLRALTGGAEGPAEVDALEALRANASSRDSGDEALIDLWLHVGDFDAALASARDSHWPDGRLTLKVAEAIWAERPGWAIEQAVRYAEQITAQVDSSKYDLVVRWLAVAAQGHEAAGSIGEWEEYFVAFTEEHRRKTSLMKRIRARFAPDASLLSASRRGEQ